MNIISGFVLVSKITGIFTLEYYVTSSRVSRRDTIVVTGSEGRKNGRIVESKSIVPGGKLDT